MLISKRTTLAGDLVVYYTRHITPVEAKMVLRVTSWRRFRPLTALLRTASRLGDGPLWYLTAIALVTFGGTVELWAVLAATVSIFICVGLFTFLKKLIGRPRPFEIWADLSCQMPPPDRFSFPSGHTMTAFAACSSLFVLIPASLGVFLPIAILIGFSRIFLGLHYPTDVLVGAMLGSLIGLAVGRLVCFYIF
ncbi:MAG: phosphatase PAP2 family protein [Deltaproteobacteria bacterium]|nr:phosphatase PAP2 family protein [Deltaproteobacteria bacterium]